MAHRAGQGYHLSANEKLCTPVAGMQEKGGLHAEILLT
jgi:hypothetical protein